METRRLFGICEKSRQDKGPGGLHFAVVLFPGSILFLDSVKTSDDFITLRQLPQGEDDQVIVEKLMEVYASWIDEAISNYNSDFYNQSRDYIAVCYQEGRICA